MQQIQRTILWAVFGLSLLFLWDAWLKHTGQPSLLSPPPPVAQGPAPASGQNAPGATPNTATPNTATPPAATGGAAAVPPVAGATGANPAAATAAAIAQPGELITLRNDVLSIDVDLTGAIIRRAELLQHKDALDKSKNMALLNSKVGALFLAETGFFSPTSQAFPNTTTRYTATPGARELGGANEVSLVLSAEGGGLKVDKTITLKKGSYEVFVSHNVTNTSAEPLAPQMFVQLTRDSHRPGSTGGATEYFGAAFYTGPVVYTDEKKFQKVTFEEIEKSKGDYAKQANNGWIGFVQHYFVTAWIPADKAVRDYSIRKRDGGLYAFSATQPLAALPAGSSTEVKHRLLIAPQDQDMLAKVAPGLELSVDYGILKVIARPLYLLLDFCHGLVKNWGWAIVLMTFVVKLLFFPLQNYAYRSMAKMKSVAPKMKAIQEKYGNDRMKLNQAMMELYKTEKINPMGSCLPVLLQIPVFIALYWVLLASVEVRNAPWIGWIKDLAAPDPMYVLPLILAATSYIQIKMSPPPPDPLQARLMTIMPLIFSVMFFFFPAGLVLYWLANNVFSILQQWYINKTVLGPAEKAAAKA